jgi:hypothetical protein
MTFDSAGQQGKVVVFVHFRKKSRARGRGQSDREEVIRAKEDTARMISP